MSVARRRGAALTDTPARRPGFTLIELMVVIAILGILAAIAIPSFMFMVKRSKTAEATSSLNAMFKGAAAYYNAERGGKGMTALVTGFCTVPSSGPAPSTPRPSKQKMVPTLEMRAIGFYVADYVYYSYSIEGMTADCDQAPSIAAVYTMRAQGDLDGNLDFSTFELVIGSDADNTLYHARGIFIVAETE